MTTKDWYTKKSIIITGGSSGIGKCLAEQLVSKGANIFIIARNPGKMAKVVNQLKNARMNIQQVIEGYACDISDRDRITSVIEGILAKHPIDILINNAGDACCNYIDRLTADDFENMINIDYLGTVWTTRAVLNHFKQKHAGTIVNISSLAGVSGVVGYSAYSPAKFAVVGFSDVLRNELKPYDISVSLVLPSDVMTPQFEAENLTKPAETKAISGTIKPYEPGQVATEILKEVAKGKYCIVPGFMSKITFLLNQHFPRFVRWLVDRETLRVKR